VVTYYWARNLKEAIFYENRVMKRGKGMKNVKAVILAAGERAKKGSG